MTYLHPCHTFEVGPGFVVGYYARCSCSWQSGGWTNRALALAALGRHLEKTANA